MDIAVIFEILANKSGENGHVECLRGSVGHCGPVGSAPAWDGTGCEFDSWECRIYIPCSIEPMITWVPWGFSGYIWLDTKIVLAKVLV